MSRIATIGMLLVFGLFVGSVATVQAGDKGSKGNNHKSSSHHGDKDHSNKSHDKDHCEKDHCDKDHCDKDNCDKDHYGDCDHNGCPTKPVQYYPGGVPPGQGPIGTPENPGKPPRHFPINTIHPIQAPVNTVKGNALKNIGTSKLGAINYGRGNTLGGKPVNNGSTTIPTIGGGFNAFGNALGHDVGSAVGFGVSTVVNGVGDIVSGVGSVLSDIF